MGSNTVSRHAIAVRTTSIVDSPLGGCCRTWFRGGWRLGLCRADRHTKGLRRKTSPFFIDICSQSVGSSPRSELINALLVLLGTIQPKRHNGYDCAHKMSFMPPACSAGW